MGEKLYFEKIKEDRGDYFVEYHPPVSPNRLATLYLTFPNAVEAEKAAELIEIKSEIWIKRYPVPIFSSAFDCTESQIEVSKFRGSSNLVTWLGTGNSNVMRSWKANEHGDFLDKDMTMPNWREIYHDIKYKTDSDVKAGAVKYAKLRRRQNLTLKAIFLLWLAVIPAGWAIFEYLGPDWLARLVLIYVLIQAAIAGLHVTGHIKPSASASKNSEEERLKSHHHYHCTINPEGFARLKAENFDNEMRAKNLKEAKRLVDAGQTNDTE